MINIPVSEEQKRKIEEKYWKWFKKYHIKELKSVIKKDCVMHKVIRAVMEMKEISEELTSIEKEEVQSIVVQLSRQKSKLFIMN